MTTRLFPILAATGALVAAGAALEVPAAAAATGPEATSQNWSGYVAGANNGSQFSAVSGSWVQPSANPSAGDGDSAFWVGLGGSGQSQSLEQTGTEADVSGGQTSYYAWYELVPAAPVKLNLAIHPGDHIYARVSVSASNVTVYLSDQTTRQSFTKTLQMSNPDTSSAEWIAEAPSVSDGQGDFQPLTLADFGSVNFTDAHATAGGHTGTISDSNWTAQPVQLSGSSAAGAVPGGLSSDGRSFSVSWQNGDGGVTVPTSTAVPSDGYGYGGGGYGYGGDGYGGGGYSYGGGGYGYGDGGYGYGGYGYGGYGEVIYAF